MRHAKSSWANSSLDDFDRPLNDRGIQDAPRMGKWIQEKELTPDLILSSTANRAKSTAEMVAESSAYQSEIRFHDYLYHGSPRDYFRALKVLSVTIDRCMVIGHNPGLENLVEHLTGEFETMPTAAIANVSLPITDWEDIDQADGQLLDIWRPKEIDD